MTTLDQLKQKISEQASENPEKFFAVNTLKKHGFKRKKCGNCGIHFWTVDEERKVCGEPDCGQGYTFINNSPTEKKFTFTTAWKEFSKFMEKRGYTPIDRYPVAARWRDDTEFVRASIYDFQPYVVTGELEPPANPLVVPQFCVRFNDIENVGVTGRHYTGFVMVGQHAFTDPESYEQEKYFEDMLEWALKGIGLPKEKLVLHEDSWGGGGNLGACMEFFIDGLELFNQVYMFYEIDDSEKGYSELDTKVLDMGMGLERIVWITHGSQTSYEANMEKVVEKLYRQTGVSPDKQVWEKFLPYSSYLNLDEVEDIEKTWEEIAEKIGEEKEGLKKEIMPAAALYSVADHTRSLLFALSDKILPSNTGEQHSLRIIARRSLDFIDKYGWDIDICDVVEWHAEEMEDIFPELLENIESVKEILEEEKKKYQKMRKKAEKIIGKLDKEIDEEKMVELYDTEGISPDLLQRLGVKVVKSPDFYSKVSEKHGEGVKKDNEDEKFPEIREVPKTELKYIEDEEKLEFEAEVLQLVEKDGIHYIILDKTYFYPTSGGQLHDIGKIDNTDVTEVIKVEGRVLHNIDSKIDKKKGDTVKCSINADRRKLLTQHHSATHLINAAARKVLGNHVMQAGAKKTTKKARLDITHYKTVTREELEKIEEQANKWVEEGLGVTKTVVSKTEAEQKYGFTVYQGGVPPGNKLRLVKVGGEMDVQACGGTHVQNTSEIEKIALVGSSKVQDGIIRLEYKAGEAADKYIKEREELQKRLGNWINTEGYSLEELADIFKVPEDQLFNVVQRFVDEWDDQKKEINKLKKVFREEPEDIDYKNRPRNPERLFEQWKEQKKDIESLQKMLEDEITEELLEKDEDSVFKEVPINDVGTLIRLTQQITREQPDKSAIIKGENAVIASKGEESNAEVVEKVRELAEVVQENGSLVKGFKLKK